MFTLYIKYVAFGHIVNAKDFNIIGKFENFVSGKTFKNCTFKNIQPFAEYMRSCRVDIDN